MFLVGQKLTVLATFALLWAEFLASSAPLLVQYAAWMFFGSGSPPERGGSIYTPVEHFCFTFLNLLCQLEVRTGRHVRRVTLRMAK